MKRFRCAIYTRKSTDEGLEQAFNSLDAQREACEAYVRSQAGLGWEVLATRYDDPAVSGGTMDRPALKSLLEDIGAGSVDVVVVYKIDRLTRSLMDFARIVEVFDRHNVSFVSITQQFSTTTSMGRLTLNVLLSFAQFEREVTAERIRDKIAASKQKGLWMGGLPPLGYDVVNRGLVVNEAEAKAVRQIFGLYLKHRSVRRLKEVLDQEGVLTKGHAAGVGGKPFSRGQLYRLLSNPVYVGQVAHKGKVFAGQHKAIVDKPLWDEVQALLHNLAAERRTRTNSRHPSVLTGLLFDETGDRLSPSHAVKGGRRYRYYISHRLMTKTDAGGWRLPAADLERIVCRRVSLALEDRAWLIDVLGLKTLSPADLKTALAEAGVLSAVLSSPHHAERRTGLMAVVSRITVEPGKVVISINTQELAQFLGLTHPVEHGEVSLVCHISLRRRGVEGRLIVADQSPPVVDAKLVEILTKAHRWAALLTTGKIESLEALAGSGGILASEVSRILPLAFLAPDVTEAILLGRQPIDLTAERLKRTPIPILWHDQRRILRFD
ncbi:MAG: recombinase family protein [Hyphomicrobiales bacterium]